MKIIFKKVGCPTEVREFDKLELADMQNMVGGLIECFHVGNGVDMWLNDEGKLLPLPINLAIGSQDKEILDTIHGDVFFASGNGEGDTVGLSEEQINWVNKQFDEAEYALSFTENGLEFVPVWVYAPMNC